MPVDDSSKPPVMLPQDTSAGSRRLNLGRLARKRLFSGVARKDIGRIFRPKNASKSILANARSANYFRSVKRRCVKWPGSAPTSIDCGRCEARTTQHRKDRPLNSQAPAFRSGTLIRLGDVCELVGVCRSTVLVSATSHAGMERPLGIQRSVQEHRDRMRRRIFAAKCCDPIRRVAPNIDRGAVDRALDSMQAFSYAPRVLRLDLRETDPQTALTQDQRLTIEFRALRGPELGAQQPASLCFPW
jgi:hypothetical protein